MNQILPEVSKFLSAQPLKMFIGGAWTDATGGETFETRDPGDGKVIARVAAGDKRDIDRAVTAAQQAFRKSGWATLPPNDRPVFLPPPPRPVEKKR